MDDSTQLTTTTSQDLALIPEMDDAMTRMAASTIKFTDKVASYTLKFMVFYAVLCVYVLNQLNTLPRCSSGRRCATPMLDLTQDVDVLIHASLSGDVDTNVAPTYVARNASGKSYDATIPLSADVRKGGAPLTAHVFLLPSRQGDWDWSNDTAALARAFCRLRALDGSATRHEPAHEAAEAAPGGRVCRSGRRREHGVALALRALAPRDPDARRW